MSRTKHPLRLKSKRWSDYVSRYWVANSPGETPTPEPSLGYPTDMVYEFEDYSWLSRPVPGTNYGEIPLFWTPQQAARTLQMSLDDYVAAGNAPVLCPRPRPPQRPKAVLYNTYILGVLFPSVVDVVALAVAGLEDALLAKGVDVMRVYTPFFVGFDPGDTHGTRVLRGTGSPVAVTGPYTEMGDLWEIGHDGDRLNVYRALGGEPYEAGECLYITPLTMYDLDTPFFGVTNNGVGNPATYGDLPEFLAAEVAFLNAVAQRHDRCGFHVVMNGADYYPPGATPPLAWPRTHQTVLPQLAASVPTFSFYAYTASDNFARDEGEEAVAPFTNSIRDKIIEFFNL